MDNLSIHKKKKVLERMDELGFRWAYTPRYSPRYNPIEEVFAEVKQYIKKKRLNAIQNRRGLNLKALIYEAFERINYLNISGCIRRS